jgi:hypothetical protein
LPPLLPPLLPVIAIAYYCPPATATFACAYTRLVIDQRGYFVFLLLKIRSNSKESKFAMALGENLISFYYYFTKIRTIAKVKIRTIAKVKIRQKLLVFILIIKI